MKTTSDEKPDVEHIESVSQDSRNVDSLTQESDEDFSDIDEAKLRHKIDIRIIPLFTILYLLSFLDRGNIGNAKIEGLAEDLKLRGNEYNLCLTIFFIFYASMEVPSNTILHHVSPRVFIPLTMVLWSIVMTLMGTVRNYHQLLATRALLGLFEASLFPGISYILSMYYKKNEVLVRQAIFFSAASMAGAFSGVLAAAISKMDGIGGYEGWRWIFILEGLLTFIVALVSFFYFPQYPGKCYFLTERERKFAVWRTKHSGNETQRSVVKTDENDVGETLGEQKLAERYLGEDHEHKKKYFWAVFKDWHSYAMLCVYWGVCVPLYAISLFTPTIIRTLGYTSTKAQLMSAPIYVVAAVFSIAQAFWSNRNGYRSPFLIFNFLCMAVGYTIALAIDPRKNPHAVYAGLYIAALGIYPAIPMTIIWFSNNLSGSYKRAVGIGFQIGFGNFSGAFASNFYRTQDSPRYQLGHALVLGFVLMGLFFIMSLVVGYSLSNRKKRRDLATGVYDSYSDEVLMEMGDKNPYFTYRL
ncbi:putative uncharacterized transporter [Clavispora lusitaniae]|uniref:Uncharacterized transporter n=1 Tax=Clavispora lusitaniae TaxID=36911 RepID=A0ACD0WNA3_CLALS|nr:putative uncharacterized transporter [Clavispora lusitaniae]QFZ34374.1 putative uncharacterized transporter [Clavispora lusitaniae]QFZ40058.1 putative uncharacterized transporter [Clavispora lusitaniae]QFZ45740.1 putative uncharacterized transporter [Clavispora lusitaniae]QFZ51404.1 putative uncharacterized transporter [Clavispora lusitaniae]